MADISITYTELRGKSVQVGCTVGSVNAADIVLRCNLQGTLHASDHLFCYWEKRASANDRVYVGKLRKGVETYYSAFIDLGGEFAAGDELLMEHDASANTIKVYLNESLVINVSVTDPVIDRFGYTGVSTFNGVGAVDDFVSNNLGTDFFYTSFTDSDTDPLPGFTTCRGTGFELVSNAAQSVDTSASGTAHNVTKGTNQRLKVSLSTANTGSIRLMTNMVDDSDYLDDHIEIDFDVQAGTDDLSCWTRISSTWTQRGSAVNMPAEISTDPVLEIIHDSTYNKMRVYVDDAFVTEFTSLGFSEVELTGYPGIYSGGSSTCGITDFLSETLTVGPRNIIPGAQTVDQETNLSIDDICVVDEMRNISTVQLTVGDGICTVTLQGSATISAGTNGTATLTISGNREDINDTLETLVYRGDVAFSGTDTLTVVSTDAESNTDTDVFNIEVLTDSNSAPVNTIPSSIDNVIQGVETAITGLSATDTDGNLASVQLTVVNGTVSVTLSGSAIISAGADDSDTLTIAGSETDINATLATLQYTSGASFTGTETLTMLSSDSATVPLMDSDELNFTVEAVLVGANDWYLGVGVKV